jgi:hypothetical protein
MRGRVIGSVLATGLLAGCAMTGPGKPGGLLRVHNIEKLMEVIVEPQALAFWRSAGTVTDATGAHDLRPTTDEGWLIARSGAATVAEAGNLMMTPLYAKGRKADWMRYSRELVEVGKLAEEAVIDRDSDAIFEIGGRMYEVCRACHRAYPPGPGEE